VTFLRRASNDAVAVGLVKLKIAVFVARRLLDFCIVIVVLLFDEFFGMRTEIK
jgi:hypothetical protein